ncbi:actinodin2 isoform X1 [Pangasianodon hypophthalmus]|uniref:actinodin2 isoform X1 n=1 Tax=Pangasianodon hypophthalmus TaxID=310915 RepID=UPI000EFED335|nr:actinodin2 isoform X1 [Pangasianodon hypophthalmus]XP_026792067.3 actinodin2 isoform X1 [Pangasianodon hypophthalmus]
MARIKLSLLFAGIVLAVILMPDFLGAGPVGHPEQEEVAEVAEEKPASSLALKKLTRNKRNAVAYYKRLPEFWAWYKYYMSTHNQEGIESLDQLYLIYLQNKHRVDGDNSYKHYLTHLSEVYKACAKSDDPDCIPEYTSKPTAKIVLPAAMKQAPVNVCNPYLDPYCIFSVGPQAAPEEPPPAPVSVKSPSPLLLPSPIRTPSGYHYYAPALQPFLSSEQRAELLRICSPSDVECLQYHLRAAYGYRPALTPVPSYAYLGCDPSKDPYCRPTMLAKNPSGLYHVYPHCNPAVDPLCVSNIAPAAQSAEEAPREQHCNPLFETGCNPLTANRLVTLKAPVLQYVPQGELTPLHLAALMKPLPISQQAKSSATECHPYDPSCSNFSPPASIEAFENMQGGIILPHPDCDPETDYNCRLRRAGPTDNKKAAEDPKDELERGDDTSNTNVAPQYQVSRFEDFLRGYLGHYKK